jgi:hypothetical protein
MIVDAEGYGVVKAIESLLEDAEDGEIQPELMESALEMAEIVAATAADGPRLVSRSTVIDFAPGKREARPDITPIAGPLVGADGSSGVVPAPGAWPDPTPIHRRSSSRRPCRSWCSPRS